MIKIFLVVLFTLVAIFLPAFMIEKRKKKVMLLAKKMKPTKISLISPMVMINLSVTTKSRINATYNTYNNLLNTYEEYKQKVMERYKENERD